MINLVGPITADLILAQVKDRPDFGEEHMVDDMILRPGALANVILPMARLGVKQRVISIVGRDEFGNNICNEIAPYIEDRIVRSDTPTTLSVSVVQDTGARYFVTYSGNAYEFTQDIVNQAQDFADAKACLLYGYFLIPKFGPDAARNCLNRAREAGQITFFDANSAIDGWSQSSRDEILSLLPYIDYFMPNDEELVNLTGITNVEEAVNFLQSKGATNIILKRGSKGATGFTSEGVIHHSGYPVQAYDTTGAGDSFNAGFIYSILEGNSVHSSITIGNALASHVVSRKENRYPDLFEIQSRIHAGHVRL